MRPLSIAVRFQEYHALTLCGAELPASGQTGPAVITLNTEESSFDMWKWKTGHLCTSLDMLGEGCQLRPTSSNSTRIIRHVDVGTMR
ncbi:hypothetical protein H2248_010580 [Termitomyces sp. 'cryptogamus']|nr:hypothetical protein H2248_010580 [Termitomyces sp. 'cryptogamus']